ncbi:protein FAM3D isoform X5 [Dipodomys merriami]|uniref:protein FAM3D isoform X5 n=1 Tax=Dipodomys merriami TaxID=94247 RepID=UPI00384B11C4
MRVSGLIRLSALLFALVAIWIFLRNSSSFSRKTIRLPRWLGKAPPEIPSQSDTGTDTENQASGKTALRSHLLGERQIGAANVVGPSLCFENEIIMSPVKNNVGRGLNIALVNGSTGHLLRQGSFDMYSGDPKLLEKFLVEIPEGVLVLVASYDDPGTKMNDEIRKLFSNLGSVYAKHLGFRDSWVFLGARDLKNKSPFEQFLKNSPGTNKYEGWPELLELEGCVPRKVF